MTREQMIKPAVLIGRLNILRDDIWTALSGTPPPAPADLVALVLEWQQADHAMEHDGTPAGAESGRYLLAHARLRAWTQAPTAEEVARKAALRELLTMRLRDDIAECSRGLDRIEAKIKAEWAPVDTPEPQPARDAEGRDVLSPLSLTSWPDDAQAPDDTKHVRDSQLRYSQYQMDEATKPLHAEIERLRAVDTPPRVTDMPAIELGDIIDYMRVPGDDIGPVIAIPCTGDRDEAQLVPLAAITAIYRTPLWRRYDRLTCDRCGMWTQGVNQPGDVCGSSTCRGHYRDRDPQEGR